jgi:hypothetical protein
VPQTKKIAETVVKVEATEKQQKICPARCSSIRQVELLLSCGGQVQNSQPRVNSVSGSTLSPG